MRMGIENLQHHHCFCLMVPAEDRFSFHLRVTFNISDDTPGWQDNLRNLYMKMPDVDFLFFQWIALNILQIIIFVYLSRSTPTVMMCLSKLFSLVLSSVLESNHVYRLSRQHSFISVCSTNSI